MKIDFTELSDEDLTALIVNAMQEWASRQITPQATVIKRQPPPAPRVLQIAEPPEEDKEFALRIKAMMQQGSTSRQVNGALSPRSPSSTRHGCDGRAYPRSQVRPPGETLPRP